MESCAFPENPIFYAIAAPPYLNKTSAAQSPFVDVFYAEGIYSTWMPERRVYLVADAPPETEVVEEPDLPSRLFIYPQQGQTEQQQANDRYECHSWAKVRRDLIRLNPAAVFLQGRAAKGGVSTTGP